MPFPANRRLVTEAALAVALDDLPPSSGPSSIARIFFPSTHMQKLYGATTYVNTTTGAQATLLDPNDNTGLIFTTDAAQMAGWQTFDAYLVAFNEQGDPGNARMNLSRFAPVFFGGTYSQDGSTNYGDISLAAGAPGVRSDVQLVFGSTVPTIDAGITWVLTRKAADPADTLATFLGVVGIIFVKAS